MMLFFFSLLSKLWRSQNTRIHTRGILKYSMLQKWIKWERRTGEGGKGGWPCRKEKLPPRLSGWSEAKWEPTEHGATKNAKKNEVSTKNKPTPFSRELHTDSKFTSIKSGFKKFFSTILKIQNGVKSLPPLLIINPLAEKRTRLRVYTYSHVWNGINIFSMNKSLRGRGRWPFKIYLSPESDRFKSRTVY